MLGARAALGLVLAAHAGCAWASCAYGTALHPRAEGGEVEISNFSYIGETGPANWVSLDRAANGLCANGTHQSPINLAGGVTSTVPAAQVALTLADMPRGAAFENLGTTVEVVAPANAGTMAVGNASFGLRQFHFHLPSEHLEHGMSRAMEMHMVWQGAAPNQVAVIGVFIDVADDARNRNQAQRGRRPPRQQRDATTKPSALLEAVFRSVEDIATPGTTVQTRPLVMSELVDTLRAGSFRTYQGSLTTPPCSEGVQWLVSDQRLGIQRTTFARARSVIGFNARFPQNAPGGVNVLALASQRP